MKPNLQRSQQLFVILTSFPRDLYKKLILECIDLLLLLSLHTASHSLHYAKRWLDLHSLVHSSHFQFSNVVTMRQQSFHRDERKQSCCPILARLLFVEKEIATTDSSVIVLSETKVFTPTQRSHCIPMTLIHSPAEVLQRSKVCSGRVPAEWMCLALEVDQRLMRRQKAIFPENLQLMRNTTHLC